jgi:hypothetical protein
MPPTPGWWGRGKVLGACFFVLTWIALIADATLITAAEAR